MRFSLLLTTLLLASLPATAQTLVGWDFEDCSVDAAMTADSGTAANAAKTVTVSGTGPSCSTGNPGATAASFTSMANQEASEAVFPVDASGAGDLDVAFSLRPSNTANKWWRVEVSIAQGAWSALTPLAEAVGSSWTDHSYDLPAGADGQADVRVRIVATDSNGDGSGTFVQADGDGTPSNGGTLRIDEVIISAATGVDAGPVVMDAGQPPQDAGFDAGPPPPADAGPAGAPPIISEVAWMGTGASANDEWVELYNPGPTIPDLSRFRLIDNDGVEVLPAVSMPTGSVLVLEDDALTTSLNPPDAEVPDTFNGLSNGTGEFLRICPEGQENDLPACDVARVQGGAWPAGSSSPRATMVRRRADLDGSFPSSWTTYAGAPSSVTDANGTAIAGSPGVFVEEPAGVDAGPGGDDGGTPPPFDAGPNETPTISLSSPSGSVTSAGEVSVVYSAADADGADTVSVSLFYDTDSAGFDGVLIARGLPAGTDRSYTWLTAEVPSGDYRVFGVATDDRGERAYGYAPGNVVVEGGGASAGGTITLIEPDGVDDGPVEGRYLISWEVDVPDGEDGLVSLFYDDDDVGTDGEPIIFGLPLLGTDGEPGPRAYNWAPGEEVPPGAYAIYATLEWRGGTVSDYSEFLQVGETGCACGASGDEGAFSGILGGMLLAAWALCRRRRGQRRRCA